MKSDPKYGAAGQKKAGSGGGGARKPHYGTQGQKNGTRNKPCGPRFGTQGQSKAG